MKPKQAQKSVRWFSPGELLRTAPQVAKASMFGQYADARVVEALRTASGSEERTGGEKSEKGDSRRLYTDLSGEPTPFWFDYVADTGDGWDATYTVAYYMAQDTLRLARSDRKQAGRSGTPPDDVHADVTRRGKLLVLGGDQVYPTASRKEYENRLILPFSWAFPKQPNAMQASAPCVFSLPGNHDWYDGLVAFTRLFCAKGWFAGWYAPQERSYFAVKLPRGWWVIGTDIQLGHEIDGPQRAYFEQIAKEMRDGDSIILCHAEPHWYLETIYHGFYDAKSIRDLEALFAESGRAQVKVFLAGDYHHYRRHADQGEVHKIMAGGGGAFLHLTNGPDDQVLKASPNTGGSPDDWARAHAEGRFERKMIYPSWWTSWWLCWLNLLFPLRNGTFGLATAGIYAFLACTLLPLGDWLRGGITGSRAVATFHHLLADPFSLFIVILSTLAIFLFTDTHSRTQRIIGGSIHALMHLAGAALLGWSSLDLAAAWGPSWNLLQVLLAVAITAVGGYVIGPLILGLYLSVSLNVFRRHANEASSALRSPHYKNFLRFRIEEPGGLTIYPVGIRRAASRWGKPNHPTRSVLAPQNGTWPFLIEGPLGCNRKT